MKFNKTMLGIILAAFLLVVCGYYSFGDSNDVEQSSLMTSSAFSFNDIEKGEFYSYESDAVEYENGDRVDITWTYINPYEESTDFKVVVEFADYTDSSKFTLDAFGDTYSETMQFTLNDTELGAYPCTLKGYVYEDEFNLYQTIDLGDINVVETKTNTTYDNPTLTITTIPETTDIAYKYDSVVGAGSSTTFIVPRNNDYKFSIIAEGYEPYTFITNIGDESETVNVMLAEITPRDNEYTIDFNIENQNDEPIENVIVFVEGVKYIATDGTISIDVPNGDVPVIIMKEGCQPFVHTYEVENNGEYTIIINEIGTELSITSTITEASVTTDDDSETETETTEIDTTNTNVNTTSVDTVSDADVTVEVNSASLENIAFPIILLVIVGFFFAKRK